MTQRTKSRRPGPRIEKEVTGDQSPRVPATPVSPPRAASIARPPPASSGRWLGKELSECGQRLLQSRCRQLLQAARRTPLSRDASNAHVRAKSVRQEVRCHRGLTCAYVRAGYGEHTGREVVLPPERLSCPPWGAKGIAASHSSPFLRT